MHDPDDVDTVEITLPRPPGTEPPSPFSSLVQVDLAALSDVGKVRANNEDHYLVVRFGRFLEPLLTNLPANTVPSADRETGYGLVIADGMGGVAGGEVASRLAIQTLVNLALHVPDWILRPDDKFLDEALRRNEERYHQVNTTLNEKALAEPALDGMGTTLTVALSLGAALLITHIGDSRAYLFRQGKLSQLTRDHTLAQAQADAGWIRQDEVVQSRVRHVLTRSLGGGAGEIRPEMQRFQLADGDCVLLCSDGLTDMVDEGTISAILGSGLAAEPTCRRLIDRALEQGGKDNVTVVMARYRLPPGAV